LYHLVIVTDLFVLVDTEQRSWESPLRRKVVIARQRRPGLAQG